MMSDARPALWGIDFPGFDSKTAKTFDTCDSHVVPHRSTEQAQWCLTSEFGRDLVLSPWYERMMGVMEHIRHLLPGVWDNTC